MFFKSFNYASITQIFYNIPIFKYSSILPLKPEKKSVRKKTEDSENE
jgi:hypothetical protein